MKWFKKLSPASPESPHNHHEHLRAKNSDLHPLKKSNSLPTSTAASSEECPTSNKMQKSLSVLAFHNFEIIDPELFFQDPDHVRNYKEEEIFLKIMSEWEIIENPSANMGNYFSADFEEEFVQMITQQTADNAAVGQSASAAAANFQSITELYDNSCSATASKARKRTYKRSLTELIFADKIEIGLLPPMGGGSTTSSSSATSSPLLNKKRRRLKASDSGGSQDEYPATCSNRIIKDCAIDRSQLKTEALACSIMGAIGKCPAKDRTPRSSINDLISKASDICHPVNSCDHYDIKQFFRLDDNGNILLNMSHIEEIKGIGLAARENQKLYKRYLKEGRTAEENRPCNRRCCMELLKHMLELLWDKIKCKCCVRY